MTTKVIHFRHYITAAALAAILVLSVFALTMASADSRADQASITEVSVAQPLGLEDVVKRHLRAVRERNEQQAYAYITPAFQEKYEDPEGFMKALRYSYRPLYKHLSYRFLESNAFGNITMQQMEITGQDGKTVTVLVRLMRQEDGSWLIDGYTILEAEEDPI